MRTRLAAAAVLVMLVPAVGVADHGGVGLTSIAGHVRDVFGEPVRACVTAYGYATRASTITDPTDGSYLLDVQIPGRYTLVVDDVVELFGDRCPFTGSTFWRFERQQRVVSTTGMDGPVDFELAYHLGAGVWGPVCCIRSAARPGAEVQLYAQTALRAADDVEVVWTDETSGAQVTIPRWVDFWQEEYGIAGYEARVTIPDDRPDGEYVSTFRTIHPDGLRVTNSYAVTTLVDSVPPVIGEVFPADGAVVPARIRPWLTATDDAAGVADYRTRMEIRDLTAGGSPRIVWSFDTGGGRIRAANDVVLEEGRTYEARLSVRDHADNAASRTVTFSTSGAGEYLTYGPVDPVSDPHTPVELTIGGAIDPATMFMRVQRVGGGWGTLTDVRPNHDPATGRVWLQPVDEPAFTEDGKMPRLIPGFYDVRVRGTHLGTGENRRLQWTFQVL